MSRGRLVALVAVISALLAAGAVVAIVKAPFGPFVETASAHREEIPAGPGPQYALKERIINLSDQGARRYLKIAATIEFTVDSGEFRSASHEGRAEKQAEFEKTIAPWGPVIDDLVLSLASARSSAELSAPEGKIQLKNEIRAGVNHLLSGEKVGNVYFTQFVIQ